MMGVHSLATWPVERTRILDDYLFVQISECIKLKNILLIFFLLLLSGCGVNLLNGMGPEADTPALQEIYDKAKQKGDELAKAGSITWVEASQKVRDADKYIADRKADFRTSWKFDYDDQEYHAYVISIAEKVDSGVLSFHEFEALRTAKFNEIRYRRASSIANNQNQSSTNTFQRRTGFVCTLSRTVPSWSGSHCVYNCPTGEFIETVGHGKMCQISIRR